MKISAKVLAFTALQSSIWGATAFVQAPNTFSIKSPSKSTSAIASSFDTGSSVSTGTDSPFFARASRAGGLGPRRTNIDSGAPEVLVQVGSLQTWSLTTSYIERVQVQLGTEGRPLNANLELWAGPDNTPQKIDVYVEDGAMRPFNCVIETPRGNNAVCVRNTGNLEFPIAAFVEADVEGRIDNGSMLTDSRTIQGGAIQTYPFEPSVASVQVLLKTDGRPLNARIELLQGPNNKKQVMEVYTEDGLERPLYTIIETPGPGNVVRIVNTATMEYPLYASVEAYEISSGYDSNDGDDLLVLGRQY